MDTKDNMKGKDSKGRFTKGNPGGGRPKKQPTTRDFLKALAPLLEKSALDKILDLMNSKDDAIALQANIAFLDLCMKYASDDKKKPLPPVTPLPLEDFIQQYITPLSN